MVTPEIVGLPRSTQRGILGDYDRTLTGVALIGVDRVDAAHCDLARRLRTLWL